MPLMEPSSIRFVFNEPVSLDAFIELIFWSVTFKSMILREFTELVESWAVVMDRGRTETCEPLIWMVDESPVKLEDEKLT